MCGAVSYKELAINYAQYDFDSRSTYYGEHLSKSWPEVHAMYLEAMRDLAFRADANAALRAGWPSDYDLAGLTDDKRYALMLRV